jgi:hypothetical protein
VNRISNVVARNARQSDLINEGRDAGLDVAYQLGPQIDDMSASKALRLNAPANSIARLKDPYRGTASLEATRHRQPRKACADNDRVNHGTVLDRPAAN